MNKFIQKGFFVLKVKVIYKLISSIRKYCYFFLGMRIGKNTYLSKIVTTFPNQVSIGNNCILEKNIYFRYDGIWRSGTTINIGNNVFIGQGCEFNINCGIFIGNYTNIASGCKFIDHDHGTAAGSLIGPQASISKEIVLEEDVWLGVNVVVLKGVHIGKGSVVAAGSVVTKNVGENVIIGGVPAKFLKKRV